jgi:hypothetical protein
VLQGHATNLVATLAGLTTSGKTLLKQKAA